MSKHKITIIGLGLIGGSLAKALRGKAGFSDIIAVDTNKDAIEAAMKEGVISEGKEVPGQSVYTSDIIFICTPVRWIPGYIAMLAPHVKEDCIITDVGSTKDEIIQCVNKMADPPCFIGGHPMAGTEKSGYSGSYAHMFENAYYVLTPSRTTTRDSLEAVEDIVRQIGAIPIIMDSKEHDTAVGGVSHLPHIIAAALVNLVKELDKNNGVMKTLAAGGFRDITRIASSNPYLWENIVSSNKSCILKLISMLEEMLENFAADLNNDNTNEIHSFFTEAGKFRDSISDQAPGLVRPVYRILADVQDKPGVIGEIATILGKHNVNIKNINVTNSREFEQGCLVISLQDKNSTNIAFDLLKNAGYKVYKEK
jgi:prephenate dehydrogenase